MKTRNKILLAIIVTLNAIHCLAYDIEVGGLAYNVNEDNESVTLMDYVGNPDTLKCFVIPDYIVHADGIYPVTSSMINFYNKNVDLNEMYFGRNLKEIYPSSLKGISSVKHITWNSISCECYPIITGANTHNVLSAKDEIMYKGIAGLNTSEVESITIGDEVKSLPTASSPFLPFAKIQSLHIPASLTEGLDGSTFYSCLELKEITVDENNTEYDSRVNCNAVVRTADNTLVLTCKSTHIPPTVTTISENAYLVNPFIKEVYIPSSINSIKSNAFRDCKELEKLTIDVANPDEIELGYNVFGIHSIFTNQWEGVPVNTCKLYVPKGSAELYRQAAQWKEFANIQEVAYTDPLGGDVDGSGMVDVEDVNAAVNIALKLSTAADYPGNADLDGNGIVDVEDVNALVNKILKLQ